MLHVASTSRNGYRCAFRHYSWRNTATGVNQGAIWYAESRERVRVVLDESLRETALEAVSRLRLSVSHARIPPPLKDSPKCPRCALVSICLPDEVSALGGSDLAPRPIAVNRDEALPLVVQSQRARISKKGNTLTIADEEQGDTTVRLIDVSDVSLFGNVSITTPALAALMEREIPVTFHSHSGWFRGMAHGVGHRNVEVRTAQYRSSFEDGFRLRFARGFGCREDTQPANNPAPQLAGRSRCPESGARSPEGGAKIDGRRDIRE